MRQLARAVFRRLPPSRRLLAELDESRARERSLGDQIQAPLFVPSGHFYSPVVSPEAAKAHLDRRPHPANVADCTGVRIDAEGMARLWDELVPLIQSAPFQDGPKPGLRYRYDNDAFAHGDGVVLHALLRRLRPKRLIEVGSGWSSACTLDTVGRFLDGQTRITFIEPYPALLQSLLGDAPADVRAHGVQETPLALFDELEAGDVLFIDSTHIMATGSDVHFELFEVLPRLKPGVVVHFHDVFWPFEYPYAWAVTQNRSWNEIYALRAFLTQNDAWDILLFNDYFGLRHLEQIEATVPAFLTNPGGSLWLQKR